MQKYDWVAEKENLRRMYCVEKMSIASIAKHYGCAYKTVSAAMKKSGIETRRPGDSSRCNAKYDVDSHYFDSIDSETKAYVLGLIAADGHVSKNGVLMFSFQTEDSAILDDIKVALRSNHPIGEKHNGTSKTLNITSSILCMRLKEIGLNNNKSKWFDFRCVLSHIPENLLHHFVRGFFDGDGSIRIYNYPYFKKHSYHFGLTSILPVCEFFNQYFNFRTKLANEGNGIWTCVSSNHTKIVEAGHKMYDGATIYFPRKKRTFERIELLCEQEYNCCNLQRL